MLGSPVSPAVGRLDRGLEINTFELGILLTNPLHVIQELQEHDPGELRETIDLTAQALVRAHLVPTELEDRA
ncbi:hypothetical protein D3C86_1715070 [compost metagenome]